MSKGAPKHGSKARGGRAAKPGRESASRTAPESAPAARPDPEPEPEPAGSGLVEYAEGDDASSFAQMLGGLIEANVLGRPEKQNDFDTLRGRVGIEVGDIEEAVTLDFEGGHLVVHNGLKPKRHITIRADSETVMQLSSLRIGPLGMAIYVDSTGRGIVRKLLSRKLRIDGIPFQIDKLNKVTRLFSVM